MPFYVDSYVLVAVRFIFSSQKTDSDLKNYKQQQEDFVIRYQEICKVDGEELGNVLLFVLTYFKQRLKTKASGKLMYLAN